MNNNLDSGIPEKNPDKGVGEHEISVTQTHIEDVLKESELKGFKRKIGKIDPVSLDGPLISLDEQI